MPSRLRSVALAVAVLLCASCTASAIRDAEVPVSFRTGGGDAWTFEKAIAGQVAATCDAVALDGPGGRQTIRPQPDGSFAAMLSLQAGINRVAAECRRGGKAWGAPATQQWNVRLPPHPKAVAALALTDGQLVLDGSGSRPSEAQDSAPIVAYEWRAGDGNPAGLAELPARGEKLAIPLPASDGEYRLTLRVTDARGHSSEGAAMLRIGGGKPQIFEPLTQQPAWVDRAVIYGVVPFLFGPQGFDDVTARLDELKDTGVTAILLSPVTASPSGDYGYAVTDYFGLNPRYGSERDFRDLIQAAHARGLRVLMDLVPNHLSEQHPYFADAAKRGRASPYFPFFARDATGAPVHYFDWRNLKNLDLDHPEVQNLLIEAAAFWLREYDIDGFRIDVAWGPRQRNPGFWPRWAAELTRIRPDLLLLAEASARDPYYAQHGFDAAYDWTDQLGQWAWHAAFESETQTAALLRQALVATPNAIPVFRFLNNNDTGARFITRYGLPRTRVASAMLLTLPGLPGLFTGDEVGAAFHPYQQPAPVRWEEDPHNLRLWYAHLIRLREQNPALRGDDLQLIDVEPAESVLAYLRPGDTAGDTLLVLLNYGEETQQVRLPQQALRRIGAAGRVRLVDLVNGAALRLQGGNMVVLPGHGVRILQAL